MSIRFKFRSAAAFDAVEIDGGLPAMTVRELRRKIVLKNKLTNCTGFDLVFSDAVTGQELNDENLEIPSGSSVIVKRVPAAAVTTTTMVNSATKPICSTGNCRTKETNCSVPEKGQVKEFDDFRIDLSPVPEANLQEFDPVLNINICTINREENVSSSRLRVEKLDGGFSKSSPRGADHGRTEEKCLQINIDSKYEEHEKMANLTRAEYLDAQNLGLPQELKCSLCNTFFKEAVMIPCCQRSFCRRCIHHVLITDAKCPKCFSSKYRVEDLLPNLSLREAIESFLESQILNTDLDNALQNYAPDGESGIQGKDFSCAVTVARNNLNAVKSLKSIPSLIGHKKVDEEKGGGDDLAAAADSQGENQPLNLPGTRLADEADSAVKKRNALRVDPGGGDQRFLVVETNKKGGRACYMCGSPDHFKRDCPHASTSHPMFQTGDPRFRGGMHAAPYWNVAPISPVGPYLNTYGCPGMMPFNTNMVPIPPYALPPSYMNSMYGVLPRPCSGMMGMGGVAPLVGNRGEPPRKHPEIFELRHSENERKCSIDERDHDYDGPHKRSRYGRSDEYKTRTEREKSMTSSEDGLGGKLGRKSYSEKRIDKKNRSFDDGYEKSSHSTITGRDHRSNHSERSISGGEGVRSTTARYIEKKQKHHNYSSKKYHEDSGKSDSDSSRVHHQRKKEKGVKRRVESDDRDYKKHYSHSSGMEPCYSGDQRKGCKETDSRRDFQDSRRRAESKIYGLHGGKRHMGGGPDDREDHRHQKRKRVL